MQDILLKTSRILSKNYTNLSERRTQMIKVNNLSKGYNKEKILKDINLELSGGKIYGLAGSNASGKTTLIKCLTGIYKTDGGEVLFEGKAVYDNPKAKEKIGLIFDIHNFLPLKSVTGYAKYYAGFYDDFSFDKFNNLIDKFSVPKKSQVDQLSLGQRKKLQIALVMSRSIDYLIMDEPENGLDNESRELLRNILREASDNGMCVVLSSHDLVNIENMCDELILIDNGIIKFNGSVDDCLSNIQKWRVKGNKEDLKGFVVTEVLGNILTVLSKGDREENENTLRTKGLEIIDIEKVSVIDAYTFMRKEGGAND